MSIYKIKDTKVKETSKYYYPIIRLIELVIFAENFWGVIPSGIQKYEVRLGNDGYVVDLTNKTCGCRSWQVSVIPCVHAVVAISYLNKNVEVYVAPWFHTTMFLTCYNHTINPLNGSSMWPEVPYMKPLPPQKRRLPGRPTLKRKRDQSERESRGKQGILSQKQGHDRSTCPIRLEYVASTSRPKKKKAKKCKKEKGTVEPDQVDQVQVEPVQVDAVQVDDPAQPVNDVQVDDHVPHVDVQMDGPAQTINDVPAQPTLTIDCCYA
uniref:SWIM-type domain-containing protein n=1 Tax=Lactuca sativa TaxID=4236 RepID=A0A9R1W7A9_LACSA|nr:hypothetical protein LSAT_V11C200069800 [Lactuca sativa]